MGWAPQPREAPWPEELEARLEWAKQLAAWAPGLVEQLTKGVVLEAPEPKTVKVKALTGKEKRDLLDWGEHYRHGHVPYRRDCLTCLEMMGRDRPHRRLKHPDSYCLSFDISGPFHEGRDQVVKEAKYMMLGVITVPVHQEVPLVEELRAMGVTMPGSAGSGEEGLLPEQEGEEEPHGFVEVAEEADNEIEPADAAGLHRPMRDGRPIWLNAAEMGHLRSRTSRSGSLCRIERRAMSWRLLRRSTEE